MNIKLTVFFEDPFWVGIFERIEDDKLQSARVVFGAEPKDYEVYEFVLNNYFSVRFGEEVQTEVKNYEKINPKRLQRKIKELTKETGIGTKAQRAIQLSLEARKVENKKNHKEDKEKQEKLLYLMKQEKKREKKKGH